MDSSNQLVIVALPTADDPVRTFSSEKEPHLTILYLGQNKFNSDQLTHVTEYIEHAASLLHPLFLEVIGRGELGDSNADVLFFDKRWAKSVTAFRDQLLQDPLISAAYNSTDQFPEWAPHLTMGFPATPAKKDTRDNPGFSYVRFDRVALWTGDSTGPTFTLKPDDGMEVAMSQMEQGLSIVSGILSSPLEEELSHHGVKGMKWGVRKDHGHEGQSARTSKIDKLDKKFERKSQAPKTTFQIHNRAADLTNKNDVDRINNKPQYKDKDFTKDTPLRQEYYKEHQRAYLNNLEKAASELGTNASGTKKYTILELPDGGWDVVTKDVSHAATDGSFVVNVEYDSLGHVVQVNLPKISIAQGENLTSETLSHHGVKGMKWGVRKDGSSSGSGSSADHKTAAAVTAKSSSGGTHTLSNQELQTAITRLNLETQYRTLTTNKTAVDKGLNSTKKVLQVGKTAEDVRRFLESPTGKAVKTGLKAAFVAAQVVVAAKTGGASKAATVGATVAVRRAKNHYTNV